MKLAVIGCGKQGLRHLAALRDDADLTVADRDPSRARDAADRLGARLSTIDAVFSNSAIAAIIIATPTSAHAALARRAVAAGKHVFCEKPFGGDEAAARDIADEAAARGLVGRVGYLYRLAPAIRAARAALPSLGGIDTARLLIAAPGNHAAWKHRRDEGGGVVNELVSHMIDLALWLFGPMREATVLEQQQTNPRRTIAGAAIAADADDRLTAGLISQSGVTIEIAGDFAAPHFAQSLEIRGRHGEIRASIDPEFDSVAVCRGARSLLAPGAQPDLYRAQMRGFLDAIAGGAPDDGCDLAQAASVCALLQAMR
ncbi:MAG TPA: Gfo/Idh/MocA family oxidoreductase [Stellaceae bacterium]